jgi:hypothetical protein
MLTIVVEIPDETQARAEREEMNYFALLTGDPRSSSTKLVYGVMPPGHAEQLMDCFKNGTLEMFIPKGPSDAS